MTYYGEPKVGGGPITGKFRTWRTKDIEGPMDDLLGMTKTYGLFEI
jgi:hypothetical protein